MFASRAFHNAIWSQHSNVQVSIFVTCLNFACTGLRLWQLYVAFVMTWYLALSHLAAQLKLYGPRGVLTYLAERGCAALMGHFLQEILKHGSLFYQKILKHGLTFLTEHKFSGFRMAKTPKIAKFLKNGPIYQEKSLIMGTLFLPNSPLKMGRGFEARATHCRHYFLLSENV